MKRFVLSTPPNPEGRIRLYDRDYHYLVRVRRLGAGAFFDAVLPGGTETRVRILSTADGILIGECLELPEHTACGNYPAIAPLALFQGLPKGAKMDLIVRQAAENGVSVIAPFESEYSAARINREKQARWERIIKEARQQSGSATETELRPPCLLGDLLAYWEALKKKYRQPVGILLHQEPIERAPHEKSPLEKRTFHNYLGNSPDFIALAVGPEGGFSPAEVSLFLAAGFRPLLMGNTVLRTETAALCGTAAVRIILLESESWLHRE